MLPIHRILTAIDLILDHEQLQFAKPAAFDVHLPRSVQLERQLRHRRNLYEPGRDAWSPVAARGAGVAIAHPDRFCGIGDCLKIEWSGLFVRPGLRQLSQRHCIFWAMRMTQHSMASDTYTAISNSLLITGNYIRPRAGATIE